MVALFLILVGLFSGALGGMLGIGGGIITVPALYFLFRHTNLFEAHTMQVATSTSLVVSLFISLFSSIVQYFKGTIDFSALKCLLPGLFIGCITGAITAHVVPSEFIRHLFGAGAIFLGLYFAIPQLPPIHIASSANYTLSFFTTIYGIFSSLLGIGGGILTYPTLLGYGLDAKTTSATSACTTTFSSFFGTVTYLLIALQEPKLPATLGYIDVKAFILLAIGAAITTPLGVLLSRKVNVKVSRIVFGSCLSLIGVYMLLL